MISFTKVTAIALAIACQGALPMVNAAAIKVEERSPKYVSMDFKVQSYNKTVSSNSKRDDDTPIPIYESGEEYVVTIYAGSNGNPCDVILDTGSSDLWIKDTSAGGPYDSSSSSSFKKTNTPLFDDYIKGNVSGEWAYDQFTLVEGGDTVTDYYFGDATSVYDIPFDGNLGVGLEGLESPANQGKATYTNFPAALKEQGFIDKNAYSLYMNSQEAKQGTVLFGAVDNAKYSGDLTKFSLPTHNDNLDDYNRLVVNLDSVSFNGEELSVNTLVALDSGTTFTFLPQDTYDQFRDYFKSCDQGTDSQFVDFTFGDLTIKVPYSDIIFEWEGDCYLRVYPISDSSNFPILGQNFLRHAYVVFDLDDREISMAQVKYTTDSDITTL